VVPGVALEREAVAEVVDDARGVLVVGGVAAERVVDLEDQLAGLELEMDAVDGVGIAVLRVAAPVEQRLVGAGRRRRG
jgi:hypothetical protein